jgi:adenosylcobinamide-GDP ribazoletransferase
MISAEWRYLRVAVQFLTRVPVSSFAGFDTSWLDRSAKYFPLVGAGVGAVAGLVLWVAATVLPPAVAATLAIAAGVAITGAFHEDGLADSADGLGGGLTRERRLDIMKDSRIGTYGAIVLLLTLALKITSLTAMAAEVAAAVLVAAHAGGRLATVVAIRAMRYAGDEGAAKVKPLATGISANELAVATAFGLAPAIFLLPMQAVLVCLVAGAMAAALLALQAQRLLGGYTGDILGGMEQVFETAFMIAAAGVLAASL